MNDRNENTKNHLADNNINEHNIDFATVLASSVHDMKNSITMLMDTVDVFFQNSPPQNEEQEQQFSTLQYYSSRVKNDLIHLLGLYRLQQKNMPVHIEEYVIEDLFDEQIAYSDVMLQTKHINVDVKCDEDATWYMDYDLMSGVINNIIINALKYAQTNLSLSFYQQDGYGCIEIADDGKGYPPAMLNDPQHYKQSVNFNSGSTSLGLYFAAQVANLHRRQDHRGFITLANGGPLGGGVFTIHIP